MESARRGARRGGSSLLGSAVGVVPTGRQRLGPRMRHIVVLIPAPPLPGIPHRYQMLHNYYLGPTRPDPVAERGLCQCWARWGAYPSPPDRCGIDCTNRLEEITCTEITCGYNRCSNRALDLHGYPAVEVLQVASEDHCRGSACMRSTTSPKARSSSRTVVRSIRRTCVWRVKAPLDMAVWPTP